MSSETQNNATTDRTNTSAVNILQQNIATALASMSRHGMLAHLPQRARRYIRNHHWWLTRGVHGHERYAFAGGYVYLDLNHSISMVDVALDLYEANKSQAIAKKLQPGMTFVDIGANVGQFSLLAAKRVGRAGRVIAFEPNRENADWLRKSAAANGYDHLIVKEMALSNEQGEAELYLSSSNGIHSLKPREDGRTVNRVTVQISTLDHVMHDMGIDCIDVMKIDVEGVELDVLAGGTKCLSQKDPMSIYIDVHVSLGVDFKQVANHLISAGYDIRDLRTPDTPLAELPNVMGEILACKRSDYVAKQLAYAA